VQTNVKLKLEPMSTESGILHLTQWRGNMV